MPSGRLPHRTGVSRWEDSQILPCLDFDEQMAGDLEEDSLHFA